MVTSLKKWSKLEMQDLIRFLHVKDSSPTKFQDEIVRDLWEGCHEQKICDRMTRPYFGQRVGNPLSASRNTIHKSDLGWLLHAYDQDFRQPYIEHIPTSLSDF